MDASRRVDVALFHHLGVIESGADTLVAGEIVVMDLTFETTSWPLAVVSTWQAAIWWE